MKKGILFVVIFILLCPACDYQELGNSVFVSGLGVDFAENGKFRVSVETITLSTGGQAGGYSPELVHSENNTVMGALTDMLNVTSGKLDFSHCDVIVVSHDVARNGIRKLIDNFFKDKGFNMSAKFAIARDTKAEKIFDTKPITARSQSYEISASFFNQNSVGTTCKANLLSTYESLHQSESCAAIPALMLEKSGKDDVVSLNGAALFKHDSLIGFMDGSETRLYNLVQNQLKSTSLSVPYGEGAFFQAKVLRCKSKNKAEIKSGKLHFLIDAQATISLAGSYPDGCTDTELAEDIIAYLQTGLKALSQKAQSEWDCDLFSAQEKLKKTHTNQWAALEETHGDIQYEINCRVYIKQNDRIQEI